MFAFPPVFQSGCRFDDADENAFPQQLLVSETLNGGGGAAALSVANAIFKDGWRLFFLFRRERAYNSMHVVPALEAWKEERKVIYL